MNPVNLVSSLPTPPQLVAFRPANLTMKTPLSCFGSLSVRETEPGNKGKITDANFGILGIIKIDDPNFPLLLPGGS